MGQPDDPILRSLLAENRDDVVNPGKSMWGVDKTLPNDAAWYLPQSVVGDTLYRHQGNIFHTGLMALPGGPLFKLINALSNVGYMGVSNGMGRTAPGYVDAEKERIVKANQERWRKGLLDE